MLVLLFLLVWYDVGHSQVVYMPRFIERPIRRSAMEALERLRLPVTRYFPQVDTQAAPYQGPPMLPGGYPIREVYNAPPQWMEYYAQQVPAPAEEEEPEYGNNYEYDLNPVYRPPPQFGEEVYAQEPADTYSEMVDRYLMEEPKEDMFDIQRRSGVMEREIQSQAVPNATTTVAPSSTQKVQMTAVPPAPEKKDVKSLVVPDQIEERDEEAGQKEEPLFRPLQSSQRTFWNGLRVKNTQQKSPIPFLKKIIQSGQKRNDPLLEELTSLKKKKPGV